MRPKIIFAIPPNGTRLNRSVADFSQLRSTQHEACLTLLVRLFKRGSSTKILTIILMNHVQPGLVCSCVRQYTGNRTTEAAANRANQSHVMSRQV